MQQAAEESAGIYRTQGVLEKAVGTLRTLQERATRLSLDDPSLTFNTEILSALELSYMLDVAEAIVHSALARRESRGSHQRTDHPARDDEKYLRHSLAFRTEEGPPRIEYQPVTITRWPPGRRVYGKSA
jgi:fumarate reductase flavoprotein subunit